MNIHEFIESQIESWPLAKQNYDNLTQAQERTLDMGGYTVRVQHNPARIRSTAAKVDAASVAQRPCFLCESNRPSEQKGMPLGSYEVLVNPYPIFARHLTIVSLTHEPQQLTGHVGSLFTFAQRLNGMAVFFNGAACGSSAPDHLHFQAVERSMLPIFADYEHADKTFIHRGHGYNVTAARNIGRLVYRIVCATPDVAEHAVVRLMNEALMSSSMSNVIGVNSDDSVVEIYVIPRRAFRPRQYFAEGEARIVVSPATIEVCGVIIAPMAEDYEKITPIVAADILQQVCYSDRDAVIF